MNCPVCGGEVVRRCRCPKGDSECAAGHWWHRCLACDKVVIGKSDHSRPTMECSCVSAADTAKEG